MISLVANPLSIDTNCRQCACQFDIDAYDDAVAGELGLPLPEKLHRAVGKRKAEFLSGRWCAREALRALGVDATVPIASGDNRQPLWPVGVVGSITHSHGFAAAAVAMADQITAIGIDSEYTIGEKTAANVASYILVEGESFVDHSDFVASAELYLTLIFSAKESIFKCLYPLAQRFFDFSYARIELSRDYAEGFAFTLLKPLGAHLPAGFRGRGVYAIVDDYVHTAVVLPRSGFPM